MSTTKTFNNIKSGKIHQIDATARGYYDFRTTVVPQPNKPLSYDMKVYDGLKYDVDLSKNSVRPGEINFDGTILPYVENNTLTKTNYCFGNSGTNYDLPVYNKEYVNINKIGDFDIGDGIVSNFYRDHYLTVTLPNYLSGSVNSFEICMKVHTPTNNTSNGRILNSTDSYDNLAVDLGSNPGFNFCGDTIGFGSQFDADIDLWVKVQFDGTNLSLHHSLNGVDYIQDNSKSWSKSNVWFTSNTYSLGLRSYDFVNICFFNGTIDLNECYVKINDEIINFGKNTLQKQYTGYTLEGNASINGSICSGFDSNSRLYVENWNLDISKDNIFIFTTGNSVTENQVLLMVDETNDALQFFIGNSKLEYNSGSISEYTTENLEPNTLYKVKIHRQDEHTYVFSLSKNDGAFSDEKTITSNLFSDTYTNRITVGNYSSHSSPFQGTIDLSEMYNLLSIVTESKTGIFQDYEDNGKAKTLNAFSSNNELVVLSPNENIVDYTWLGTVDIPKHNIYNVDNFYGWSDGSKSIFTKTLQLSTDTPLYNSSYEQQSLMINGTFTTTPAEENGIVSSFNGGILKLTFIDPSTEIRFYSKVNPSDQNHEHQIMGVEGTSNNIGRDNNVWRLWNGSGHYGSAFDINTDYWVCLVDNRSGTYTMYVLKDNNYIKDTLPELTSWNKEFEFSGSFFKSTNCVIGGGISNGSIIENWTGTIDLNNTWFESGNAKLWVGTSELKISSFTDNSITLTNDEVYARNNALDKHVVLPNSTSGGGEVNPPSVDPSTLKFGDRIDNRATVVGTYESSDLGKVVFALLDSSTYGVSEWAYDLYGINTDLPDDSSDSFSATHNTNYIISTYGDKIITAFKHCRQITPLNFNNRAYKCQLPNLSELAQIFNNRSKLYQLDPTASSNESYNLRNWKFGSVSAAWSSNECYQYHGYAFSSNGYNSQLSKRGDNGLAAVLPIIEIKLS